MNAFRDIVLRHYQTRSVENVRTLVRAGRRRTVVVAPTGAGKTTIAAAIVTGAVARGSRCWIVAHRRELIKQAFVRFVRAGLDPRQVGVVLGGTRHESGERAYCDGLNDEELFAQHGRRRPRALVQVCSIDSLRSRLERETPALTREEAQALEHPDVIIIDEAHRCLAATYVKLVETHPHAIILGLTATPYRADGRGLGEVYNDMVVVAQPQELIDEGFLAAPRVFTVPARDLPNLSRVRIKGGDYDAAQLSAAVDQDGLVGNVVEHWLRRAENRLTVVFAVDVAHSQRLAARFRAQGIPAEHVDGETPTAEREAVLARLQSGETRVVCNVNILAEGWDQPSVKCCVLARPTKSTGLYLQQGGRILRPWNGVEPLILDHAGCALEHGLPQDEREFSLEAAKRKKGASEAPTKVCTSCYAVVATSTRICPQCGEEFAAAAADRTEEDDGELVEVRPATFDEKAEAYRQLIAEEERRNFARGWAYHRFRERFNCAPPHGVRAPETPNLNATVAEMRVAFDQLRKKQLECDFKAGFVNMRFKARFGRWPDASWWTSAA